MTTMNNLRLWLTANTLLKKDEPLGYSYEEINNRSEILKRLRGELMDFDSVEKELITPDEPIFEACYECEDCQATDDFRGKWYCVNCKNKKLEMGAL